MCPPVVRIIFNLYTLAPHILQAHDQRACNLCGTNTSGYAMSTMNNYHRNSNHHHGEISHTGQDERTSTLSDIPAPNILSQLLADIAALLLPTYHGYYTNIVAKTSLTAHPSHYKWVTWQMRTRLTSAV